MIKNIIFDLGGVLIDWDPRYVYRTVFDTEEEVEWFLKNITKMEWNVMQDAGRDLQEATELLIAEHPKWHKEIKMYYGRWEEMLGGPIDGTVEILRDYIKNPNYRVLALTNWSHQTFPIALKYYDFLHWFEGTVVSGDEKCIKPDPKIYNTIINRYDLVAEESLFIDDNQNNVDGAIACGMQSILFKSPEELATDLKQLLT